MTIDLRPIGRVSSPLTEMADAPKQGDEGAPDAWIEVHPEFADALDGIEVGERLVVVTWLDRGRREVLRVHPRGDSSRPERGVFGTRSPHRPNPLGLHEVEVAEIEGNRLLVRSLEALDGTPVVDVKPVLEAIGAR